MVRSPDRPIQTVGYWIDKLALQPHPEGGYYRQTYRADLVLPKAGLPREFSGPRPASTAIYFLLDQNNFSAFHRLRSDELWHFYLGAPLLVHVIDDNGSYSVIRLGANPGAGEVFQAVVKAGCWFASELAPEIAQTDVAREKAAGKEKRVFAKTTTSRQSSDRQRFALAGCTVAPGFDFEDFELAKRAQLVALYPQHQALITRLTRS
jgi:uncharacterized protein